MIGVYDFIPDVFIAVNVSQSAEGLNPVIDNVKVDCARGCLTRLGGVDVL